MSRGMKVKNEYAEAIREIYAQIPKAVLASIAVSCLTVGGDYINEATERVLEEWRILHENGIVPQKPPRRAQKAKITDNNDDVHFEESSQ